MKRQRRLAGPFAKGHGQGSSDESGGPDSRRAGETRAGATAGTAFGLKARGQRGLPADLNMISPRSCAWQAGESTGDLGGRHARTAGPSSTPRKRRTRRCSSSSFFRTVAPWSCLSHSTQLIIWPRTPPAGELPARPVRVPSAASPAGLRTGDHGGRAGEASWLVAAGRPVVGTASTASRMPWTPTPPARC